MILTNLTKFYQFEYGKGRSCWTKEERNVQQTCKRKGGGVCMCQKRSAICRRHLFEPVYSRTHAFLVHIPRGDARTITLSGAVHWLHAVPSSWETNSSAQFCVHERSACCPQVVEVLPTEALPPPVNSLTKNEEMIHQQ